MMVEVKLKIEALLKILQQLLSLPITLVVPAHDA